MLKQCKDCAAEGIGEKPITEFHKNKLGRFGVSNICKIHATQRSAVWSRDNPDKRKQITAKWKKDNPDGVRNNYLKYRFSITSAIYEQMLEAQNGGCAVCHKPPPSGGALDVDHDHNCCSGSKTCGKCIRGLLCRDCNTVLGKVNDSVTHLSKMIEYIGSRQHFKCEAA